jgi:hypothetical protein
MERELGKIEGEEIKAAVQGGVDKTTRGMEGGRAAGED